MTKLKTRLAILVALLPLPAFAGPPDPYFPQLPSLSPQQRAWRQQQAWPRDMAPFDHEYTGELTIKRGTDAQVREQCPGQFHVGGNALGCSVRHLDGSTCT